MNEEKAREILGTMITDDGGLSCSSEWVDWPHGDDKDVICLDGNFLANDLEAMAWWMRNKR